MRTIKEVLRMEQFKIFDLDLNQVQKKCNKCFAIKNITLFPLRGDGINKYRKMCKDCLNSDWAYRMMANISSRTKRRLRPYTNDYKKAIYKDHNLTKEFIKQLRIEQNGLCYWTKIPIDFTLQDQLRKPSLDRIDNNKGYEIGNVVLTTLFANLGRRDATKTQYCDFLKNYLNL
jgi:hypothetical protein